MSPRKLPFYTVNDVPLECLASLLILVMIGIETWLVLPTPSVVSVIVGVAAAVAMCFAHSRPRLAALAFSLTAFYDVVLRDEFNLSLSLGALAMVFFIAVSTRIGTTIVFMVAVAALGFVGPHFVLVDLNAVVGWAISITILAVAGKLLRARRLATAERREIEERNIAAMTDTLHDSVATTLTGIALRAEALMVTSKQSPDSEIGRGLEAIASDARTAVADVRSLISLLRAPDVDSPKAKKSFSLEQIIGEFSRRVQAEGMNVASTSVGPMPSVSRTETPVLRHILREVGTNIIKHGKPKGSVLVSVESSPKALEITIHNEIAEQKVAPEHSSSVGLSRITQLASEIKASVVFQADGDDWTTKLTLPGR